jgi:hypothetical protein
MDHETALVNAFVLPERRNRLNELLRTRRGREKVSFQALGRLLVEWRVPLAADGPESV